MHVGNEEGLIELTEESRGVLSQLTSIKWKLRSPDITQLMEFSISFSMLERDQKMILLGVANSCTGKPVSDRRFVFDNAQGPEFYGIALAEILTDFDQIEFGFLGREIKAMAIRTEWEKYTNIIMENLYKQ